MAEKPESSSDIDRVSGQSITELNNALKDQFLGGEGFPSMDEISAKIFPSVLQLFKTAYRNLCRNTHDILTSSLYGQGVLLKV